MTVKVSLHRSNTDSNDMLLISEPGVVDLLMPEELEEVGVVGVGFDWISIVAT